MADHVISNPARSVFTTVHSPVMKNLIVTVEQIAPSDLSVLIVGENGAGKEQVARVIHRLSARAQHPFFRIDCAAVPSENPAREIFGYEHVTETGIEIGYGAIEKAEGGTIFLDEVGDLPMVIQRKIARVFTTRQFQRIGGQKDINCNVRVIAAVSRRSTTQVEENILLEETQYPISPIIINVPPLRQRREDIPYLIDEFLLESKSQLGGAVTKISPEALCLCLMYDWPGNIPQLRRALDHAMTMHQNHLIRAEDFPPFVHRNQPKSHGRRAFPGSANFDLSRNS
jgi:DNA-binding NtrC family response regulator